jgi:hypothetical protein
MMTPIMSTKTARIRWLGALVGLGMVWSGHFATNSVVATPQGVAGDAGVMHWHGSTPHWHTSATSPSTASSSEPGDEWTTLYESFPTSPSAGELADQRLVNISTATVTGELRALVINITTATRPAIARDKLVEAYSQAATRIHLMSRGMTTVKVDFFGRDVVVADVPNVCSDFRQMSNAAQAIVEAELSLAAYRSVDFVIPEPAGYRCDWAGWGGGKNSWNFGPRGEAPSYGTIVHEWGHQYSLPHLRAIRCSSEGRDVTLVNRAGRGAGQCATSEYGGAFSVMGPSWANNSVAITFGERSQLGWLRTGEERRVHEGTYTLGFDGPVSLLWLQNAEGDLFQVEFVKPFTQSATQGFTDPFSGNWSWFRDTPVYSHAGVMVKYLDSYRADTYGWSPNGYTATGFVLDATPETLRSTDSAFKAGQSFVDPTGSLVVDVFSVSESSAEVKVRGVPFKPDLVKNVGATATDVRGVFDVTFAPAAADAGVTHYEVQVSNDFAFTNPTTYAVTASPGRVIIPNHINFWTIFRVAAVSAVGRGDFSNGRLLEWARTAALQSAPKAETSTCKKGKRTRTVSGTTCPKGWVRA